MTWRWDPTLFEGAAPYYERGRLPYSPVLADVLRDALDLDGRGRLLDVGCGPGTVALQLAHCFEAVVGLDPDPGMLAEARRHDAPNATWVQMRAEDLPATTARTGGRFGLRPPARSKRSDTSLGEFRVVTFAASFHWMERERVARAVRGMLEPGGVVVHVDNRHREDLFDASALPLPPRTPVWTEIRKRYLGPDRRAGQGIRNTSPSGEEVVFRGAGFTGPERVLVPDARVLTRTIDDLVAEALSSSGTAPHLFGDRLDAFVEDVRTALYDLSPSGKFSVRLPDNELIIWRPGPGA